MTDLDIFPEDWDRALAVVAHPDDMEYGAASAVARWTAQGKHITYLLITRGEAGISTMDPAIVGPLREQEQRDSCAVVGVNDVDFLDHPDGLVEESIDLRADITQAIRRHRPDVLLSINHRDDWGGVGWNHPDHRAVGRALLDAARDAGNPWTFSERGDPWAGAHVVAFSGSPRPTHAVDIEDYLDKGIESLQSHRVYLEALEGDMADAAGFLRAAAERDGPRIGVKLATSFEVISV